ncbi:MAG: hypothetical protein M1820_007673 [Bogoriella megaspora]|nr:MAG: hypothetical protein M1820_007673 [Bogoriella megaspora]
MSVDRPREQLNPIAYLSQVNVDVHLGLTDKPTGYNFPAAVSIDQVEPKLHQQTRD